MATNYKIVASDITYPLVDTVIGQEPVEGVVHLEQVFLEDGKPDVTIELDDDGNAIKTPKFIEVQAMRELREALPDERATPDGVAYEILAWDEGGDEKDAVTLKFHIGRSAFEAVEPVERASILHKEIEIKYREARSSWLEGLELIGDAGDAK